MSWSNSFFLNNIGRQPEMIAWFPINGFSKYEISNDGKVRRASDGSKISKTVTPNGTRRVVLTDDNGERRNMSVPYLMAVNLFEIPEDSKVGVTYLDGNPANLSIYNLKFWPSKRRKGILVEETNRIYRSVFDCARAIRGSEQGIYACLQGRRRTYRGYHFTEIFDEY